MDKQTDLYRDRERGERDRDGRIDRHRPMDTLKDRQREGQKDGWKNRWTVEYMDGQTD